MRRLRNFKTFSDEELMIRMSRHSDREALSELYARYSVRLFHFLIKLLNGDHERAQDFLQDTFIIVYEKREAFNPQKKFYAWLFAIASNKCKKWYRDNKIKDIGPDLEVMTMPLITFPEIADGELKRELREAIHSLEYRQKVVFILRHIEGFTLIEIADIVDKSVGTVKSRLFYATQNMANKMKAYYLEHYKN